MNDSTPAPWQASRFEFQVNLEPLDYLHFMQAIRWTRLERVMAMLPTFAVACIGALGALMLSEAFVERLPVFSYWDWGVAIALAGGLIAYVVYKVFIIGPYVDSTFGGQPIGLGPTIIVADEQGIRSTSAGITTKMVWSNVQSVLAKDEHLFLMFSRLTGFIVPRRAFADDREATRFAEFVQARARAAA